MAKLSELQSIEAEGTWEVLKKVCVARGRGGKERMEFCTPFCWKRWLGIAPFIHLSLNVKYQSLTFPSSETIYILSTFYYEG